MCAKSVVPSRSSLALSHLFCLSAAPTWETCSWCAHGSASRRRRFARHSAHPRSAWSARFCTETLVTRTCRRSCGPAARMGRFQDHRRGRAPVFANLGAVSLDLRVLAFTFTIAAFDRRYSSQWRLSLRYVTSSWLTTEADRTIGDEQTREILTTVLVATEVALAFVLSHRDRVCCFAPSPTSSV